MQAHKTNLLSLKNKGKEELSNYGFLGQLLQSSRFQIQVIFLLIFILIPKVIKITKLVRDFEGR